MEFEKSDKGLSFGYDNAFRGDKALCNVIIGREIYVKNDGYSPWQGMRNDLALSYISDMTIVDGVDIDGLFFFNDYSSTLKKLTIGEGVTGYPTSLVNYSLIDTLSINDPLPPVCPEFSDAQYENIKLYVPANNIEDYKSAEGWRNFWNILASEKTTELDAVRMSSRKAGAGRYDLSGRRVGHDYRGVVIVRYTDGTTDISKEIIR